MSLADGEYEIDVSLLLHDGDTDAFAIRYGFIPDSMDQSNSLNLYQTEKESILQAKSNLGKSIIFEGAPQRHRKSNNPALESYYLAFNPENQSQVQLRRLNSTIRVSKSRNPDKWEDQLNQWKLAETSSEAQPKKVTKSIETTSVKVPVKKVSPQPQKTPQPKPKSAKPVKPVKPTSTKAKPQTTSKPTSSKRPPEKAVAKTDEMDDDFKDLEDQLEEMLGQDEVEDQDSDMDQDDFDDGMDRRYKFNPIVVNGGEEVKKNAYSFQHSQKLKPMSLRDFYGGENNDRPDDMSSSEAE